MTTDQPVDLQALAAELAAEAREHHSGRAAKSVLHGDRLRAVVMALDAGRELSDHTAPGPAVLQVVAGQLELRWQGRSVTLGAGQFTPIPDAVHSVHTDGPAVFLLTISLPG